MARVNRYILDIRQKPLSREEEFTTPYDLVGYHECIQDARRAYNVLRLLCPGCEVRITEWSYANESGG